MNPSNFVVKMFGLHDFMFHIIADSLVAGIVGCPMDEARRLIEVWWKVPLDVSEIEARADFMTWPYGWHNGKGGRGRLSFFCLWSLVGLNRCMFFASDLAGKRLDDAAKRAMFARL